MKNVRFLRSVLFTVEDWLGIYSSSCFCETSCGSLLCLWHGFNRSPIMISWWNICRNSFPSTITNAVLLINLLQRHCLSQYTTAADKRCWGKPFSLKYLQKSCQASSGCLINNHIQCIKPNPPAAHSLLPRNPEKENSHWYFRRRNITQGFRDHSALALV